MEKIKTNLACMEEMADGCVCRHFCVFFKCLLIKEIHYTDLFGAKKKKKNQDWDLPLLCPECSMCYADCPPYIIHENACYLSFRYPLSIFISHCDPVDSGVLSQPCSCNINLNTPCFLHGAWKCSRQTSCWR